MKRYFITGTDTDCGKTYVTCRLLEYFKKHEFKVKAIKPVASGCQEQEGHLISSDEVNLQLHNGTSDNICQWKLKRPISPHLAAKEDGLQVTIQELMHFCDSNHFQALDYLLIEGAGGLMVPLNEQETWIDFLKLSQIPLILVVGLKLGCLNHALLTAQVLQHYNLPCAGWIANCIDPEMLALKENIQTLVNKMPFPLLATIPFEKEPSWFEYVTNL